jgi:hypothetical protein
MKKLLYLLLIVLMASCAPLNPSYFSYKEFSAEKVVSVEKNKSDLFLGANTWMIESFNDPASIIKYSDKEEGAIIGQYLMEGNYSAGSAYIPATDTRIFATISIVVKDNSTKIKIVPLGIGRYYPPDPNGYIQPRSMPSGEDIKKKAEELITDYESFILKYRVW